MKERLGHHEEETFSKTVFGFWVYLMTDGIFFAALFATYFVLIPMDRKIPSLYSLPWVLCQTLILWASNATLGFGMHYIEKRQKKGALLWLLATAILGALFFGMQFFQFRDLLARGVSWQTSGFLSAFFTLVGTHLVHIGIGIFWLFFLFALWLRDRWTPGFLQRVWCLKLFWHFVGLVWVFIFTFVYLFPFLYS